MWHQAFFLAIEVLAAMGIGWLGEELLCAPPPECRRRQRPRGRVRALPVIRQAQAMHEIDRIATTAVAELVRIAGEELSYA